MVEKIQKQIRSLCQEKPGEEVCGFIIETDKDTEILRGVNCSNQPHKHFIIDKLTTYRAFSLGRVKFVFHSQPRSVNFSEFDKLNLNNHKLDGLLYATRIDQFQYYFAGQYFNKYIGKQFQYGTSDCFSLVKDFYCREFNIYINDYPRNATWRKNRPNYFLECYKQEGFEIASDYQQGDIILMSFGDMPPHHLGVYLDGDLILHQPRLRVSTIDVYDSKLKQSTTHILRHHALFK